MLSSDATGLYASWVTTGAASVRQDASSCNGLRKGCSPAEHTDVLHVPAHSLTQAQPKHETQQQLRLVECFTSDSLVVTRHLYVAPPCCCCKRPLYANACRPWRLRKVQPTAGHARACLQCRGKVMLPVILPSCSHLDQRASCAATSASTPPAALPSPPAPLAAAGGSVSVLCQP